MFNHLNTIASVMEAEQQLISTSEFITSDQYWNIKYAAAQRIIEIARTITKE